MKLMDEFFLATACAIITVLMLYSVFSNILGVFLGEEHMIFPAFIYCVSYDVLVMDAPQQAIGWYNTTCQ